MQAYQRPIGTSAIAVFAAHAWPSLKSARMCATKFATIARIRPVPGIGKEATLYAQHNPVIANYMRESTEGFFRGAIFAVLSIRKPIVVVPDDLKAVANGDLSPLFGHKLDAHLYLLDHGPALRERVLSAPDNATRLAALCEVPGLGIVKAGFVLQLMGYDVACLDTRNIKREGRPPREFRSDGRKGKATKAFRARITHYLAEVEGRSAEYWDHWCEDVAKVYKMTADEISELHLSIVPEGYIPF